MLVLTNILFARKSGMESITSKIVEAKKNFFKVHASNVVASTPSTISPLFVGYGIACSYPYETNS